MRFKGQKSNSNSTIGRVVAIGLAMRPKAMTMPTRQYRNTIGRRLYRKYASNVSIQKQVLSRFLREEIHAKDSTLSGCRANRAAAITLLQKAPVARKRN